MIRVVIDTNVVVSSMLSPLGNEGQVVRAAELRMMIPCYSGEVIAKYIEVLTRRKFGFRSGDIESLMEMFRAIGLRFSPKAGVGLSPDPDGFILCAMDSGASFFVTDPDATFLLSITKRLKWFLLGSFWNSLECGNSGDVLADDEGVDVVGAFVGDYGFEVHHVAHDWVVFGDAVAAEDLTGDAGGFEGHPYVVAFG